NLTLTLAQGDPGFRLLTVALVAEHDLVPGPVHPDGHDQLLQLPDRLAVDADHDVAVLQPGLVRRTAGLHAGQLDPVAVRCVTDVGTDHRIGRLTILDQHLADVHRLVDRDGEAEADVAGLAALGPDAQDGRVDPDHPTGGVDQRPARVARVDRRVGLQRVQVRRRGARVGVVTADHHRPVLGADDALRDGVGQAQRRADRDHGLTDLGGVGVTDLHRHQLLRGRHLDHRQVVGRAAAEDLRGGPGPVVVDHGDLAAVGGVLHHVV